MNANIAHRGRAFIVVLAGAAFFWTLALGVVPQLHERIHSDANRVEHSCVVTFVSSGSYDHTAHPPAVSSLIPSLQFSQIPALTPQWIQSPFLGASIFEHAPPALV